MLRHYVLMLGLFATLLVPPVVVSAKALGLESISLDWLPSEQDNGIETTHFSEVHPDLSTARVVEPIEPTPDASYGNAKAYLPVSAIEREPKPLTNFEWMWWNWVALGYLIVAVLLIGRLSCQAIKVILMARSGTHLESDELREIADSAAKKLGMTHTPTILLSDRLHSPAVVGFMRPAVALPQGVCDNLGRTELESIFLHELAHILRRDPIGLLFQRLVAAIQWANPLIKLISRDLVKTRELICDQYVISHIDRVAYSKLLFDLKMTSTCAQPMGIAIGLGTSQQILSERIEMILSSTEEANIKKMKLPQITLALGAASLSLIAFASINPVEAKKPEAGDAKLPVQATGNPAALLREIQRQYKDEDFKPTEKNFDAAHVHLNEDGMLDAIVLMKNSFYCCGSGGCTMYIYTGTPDGYRLVSRSSVTRTPIYVRQTQHNGWRDIVVHTSGGGADPADAEMIFNGTAYPSNPTVQPNTKIRKGDVLVIGEDKPKSVEQPHTEIDLRIKNLVLKYRRVPASRKEINEVRHIWQASQKFWDQYPGQIDMFFKLNFQEPHAEERKYIGQTIAEARKGLTGNAEFPYKEGKKEEFNGIIIYKFEHNQSAIDVWVKDGVVASIYFFDLI